MAETTRITVTLPTADVEALKKLTDNVSAYVAEAVARKIRHELLGEELRRYQDEHGAFTEEELAEARAEIAAVLAPDPSARAA
ncbi:hypothetical protein AB0K47_06240 [Streptomyces tirandamycinicus]|uniref:Type II toxin-antitoxin system CcdA family antitoxin n=1 Tax=Streptomyces tirandamycinicus TaxID=2174846 RepID=A0A2S1STG5_9ACTN|nr:MULTISPECIES: hypothetical protein [Streptomyces]AWI29680.1 hypothetical protein DDW44_13435 [Streptomyces tirandamycinicus]NNJ03217.1 type II toxin-antitoxin system CcdA family antitoxin [Streptomyces sp. PKU-MA01144]TFE48070.1 hypothetical protein E3E14_18395 [Streptomyces sp. ICN441]